MPGDRAEIDDRAAAAFLHAGRGLLGAKQHVAKIDRDALVPIGRRDFGELVAVVIAGVVHQDVDRADLLEEAGDGGEVLQVAALEHRRMLAIGERPDKRRALVFEDVEEDDLGALSRERRHDARTDAGPASGHDDALALKAWIDG